MTRRRYAYLHGFASSSASYKGTQLRDRLGPAVELRLPDLNVPSFERLTYSGALSAMDALHDETGGDDAGPWDLVGSSMGGYLAARWAELHPDRVQRLVLLCPGFDLNRRWPALVGAAQMARWRAEGALMMPDHGGTPRPLHWGFIADAMAHPSHPEVPCPTLIVHGRADAVVPCEGFREYARSRPHVELIEVDDDHGLSSSVDRITDEVRRFFGLAPPSKGP